MTKPILAALAAAAGLAACATPPPEAVTDLGAKACRADYDLVSAIAIAPPKEGAAYWTQAVALDEASPCVNGGNALVFRLPTEPGKVVRLGTALEAKRFAPARVSLLDASGAVTRSWSGETMPFRGGTQVAVFTPTPDEAYAVLQVVPDEMGGALERVMPGPVAALDEDAAARRGVMRYPYSQEGQVVLQVGTRRTEVTEALR